MWEAVHLAVVTWTKAGIRRRSASYGVTGLLATPASLPPADDPGKSGMWEAAPAGDLRRAGCGRWMEPPPTLGNTQAAPACISARRP